MRNWHLFTIWTNPLGGYKFLRNQVKWDIWLCRMVWYDIKWHFLVQEIFPHLGFSCSHWIYLNSIWIGLNSYELAWIQYELTWIYMKTAGHALQSLLTNNKRPQKVGHKIQKVRHGLQILLIDYKPLMIKWLEFIWIPQKSTKSQTWITSFTDRLQNIKCCT